MSIASAIEPAHKKKKAEPKATEISEVEKVDKTSWLSMDLDAVKCLTKTTVLFWVEAALREDDYEEDIVEVTNRFKEQKVNGHSLVELTAEKLAKHPYELPGGPAEVLGARIRKLKGAATEARAEAKQKAQAWFDDLCHATVSNDWIEGKFPDGPIYIRPCYRKMETLLFENSHTVPPRLTYVITGTPGVGKSTMLYYLLRRCLSANSPYKTVLFANERFQFVARMCDSKWKLEKFSENVASVGPAIGLVDVAPDGSVAGTQSNVKFQDPCGVFGLSRLVLAATVTADLIFGKDSPAHHTKKLFAPVWQPMHLQKWACKYGIKATEQVAQMCGLNVPRLLVQVQNGTFHTTLRMFVGKIGGKVTAGGEKTAAKDAHTMVLLKHSPELVEDSEHDDLNDDGDADDGKVNVQQVEDPREDPGSFIGFVSAHVEECVKALCLTREACEKMLEVLGADVAPYVFERLVVNQMNLLTTQDDGLALMDSNQSHVMTLKFSQVCELWGATTIKDSVLYRPRKWRGHDPSIDACGIQVIDGKTTLIFIQITKGSSHDRIQVRHVEKIRVPRRCSAVLCLYVVPTAVDGVSLSNGQGPLTAGSEKGNKPVSEMILAAPSVISSFPEHIRKKFEPA